MHPLMLKDNPAHRYLGIDYDLAANTMVQHLEPSVRIADGTPLGGTLMAVADPALAMPLWALMHDEEWLVTSHMHLTVCRPLVATMDTLHASGVALERSPASAFSTATVRDEHGKLVASGAARFVVRPASDLAIGASPPDGQPAAQPNPSIAELFSAGKVIDSSESGQSVRIATDTYLGNDRGGMHGGCAALIAEHGAALAARLPAGLFASELRISYLRPTPAVAGTVVVQSSVVHRGRTSCGVRTHIVLPNGKTSVLFDVTYVAG